MIFLPGYLYILATKNNPHERYSYINSCKLHFINCIDGRISENTIIFQRDLSLHMLTFKCVENSSFCLLILCS